MDLLAITTFVLFTALVAVIAWWVTRKEDLSHSTGYFLGGRSLGWGVIAGSLILTNISTEQLVGMNGGVYANGASVMAWEVVAVVAMVAMVWFFLPRYLSRGISTIPQYIELRYGRGVRVFVSAATLFTTITGLLPFVLYSGAVFFESYFGVGRMLGLGEFASLYLIVAVIALIGGAYSIFGGLKAVAVSDTINGVGLLIGGLLVPILALIQLGDGSLFAGLETIFTEHTERLSPLPPRGNPAAVPFSTLFTGMLLINVSYWCMGQFIVQRTFGAKSMKDGQKGILLAAGLKLVGLLILVLPGIIAFHLLGPDLDPADSAYPVLARRVMPWWLDGFFAAVVLGAILSSFNSALHSASTLFGLDVYQGAIRKNASDAETVTASKIVGIILMVGSIAVAPLISVFDEGLFAAMKIIGSAIATPMGAIIFAGIFLPFISARAAVVTLPLGIALQSYYVLYINAQYDTVRLLPWMGADSPAIHWLHFTFANFVFVLALMSLLSKTVLPPRRPPVPQEVENPVDMTWSRAAIPGGIMLILAVIALYATLAVVGQSNPGDSADMPTTDAASEPAPATPADLADPTDALAPVAPATPTAAPDADDATAGQP